MLRQWQKILILKNPPPANQAAMKDHVQATLSSHPTPD